MIVICAACSQPVRRPTKVAAMQRRASITLLSGAVVG
jgi:hypothetical protein